MRWADILFRKSRLFVAIFEDATASTFTTSIQILLSSFWYCSEGVNQDIAWYKLEYIPNIFKNQIKILFSSFMYPKVIMLSFRKSLYYILEIPFWFISLCLRQKYVCIQSCSLKLSNVCEWLFLYRICNLTQMVLT